MTGMCDKGFKRKDLGGNQMSKILKCFGKKCVKANEGKPYEWEYKGKKAKFYTSCPRCRSSVKVNGKK